MFGEYSYSIIILQKDSFEEACKTLLCPDRQNSDGSVEINRKIREWNYSPFNDIDKFNYLNDHGERKFPNGRNYNLHKKEERENHPIFLKSYLELIDLDNINNIQKGVSGATFISTNERGWYDWIEADINVPVGYYYCDGHDG